MRISLTFLYLQELEINIIFFKFHHSLLRMLKIIEIVQIVAVKKRDKKTHTHNHRAHTAQENPPNHWMKDTPSPITPYRTVFNKPTSLPFPAIVPCISRYLLRTSMYFLLPWRRLSKNQKSSSKFVIERTKSVNCKLASVMRAIFSSENNILILSSPF